MITCYMCQFLKAVINHMCRLIKKHVKYNDPAPSPNFECPVYGAEEEDYDEILEEVSRLLEHELPTATYPSSVASMALNSSSK